jgi:hypothetical protein
MILGSLFGALSLASDPLDRLQAIEAKLKFLIDTQSIVPNMWHKQLTCQDEQMLDRPLRLFISQNVTALLESPVARQDRECSVAFIPGRWEDTQVRESLSAKFEGVFVDDVKIVPYGEAQGNLHFFDATEYQEKAINSMAKKRHLVSIIFPSWRVVETQPELLKFFDQINKPEIVSHVFFESADGVEDKAFDEYHYCFFVNPLGNIPEYPPRQFVRAFEHHCIPITRSYDPNYWLPLGFRMEAAVWRVTKFSLEEAVPFLTRLLTESLDEQMDSLFLYRQLNSRVMQDILAYRYNLHAEERLRISACNVCMANKKLRKSTYKNTRHSVFVAIFSARANFVMRQTIRQTWLSVLLKSGTGTNRFPIEHRFFVCKRDTKAATLEEVLEFERDFFGDMVELECDDTYRSITLKSFLMYEWAAKNISHASFFLRIDDDIYIRPQPLFEQLARRTPSRYWWGSFAHLSSVVRDAEDEKSYNSEDQYSMAELFPLYTRGVLYVLSWDLLTLIVDYRDYLEKAAHPDDVALGVYLMDLINSRRISINVDDRDENRLALNPYCKHTFSQLQNTTWAVHHVSAAQMRCMWNTDNDNGLYQQFNIPISEELKQTFSNISTTNADLLQPQVNEMIRMTEFNIEEFQQQRVVVQNRRRNYFPDLCQCASAADANSENSEYDPAYGRFIP